MTVSDAQNWGVTLVTLKASFTIVIFLYYRSQDASFKGRHCIFLWVDLAETNL